MSTGLEAVLMVGDGSPTLGAPDTLEAVAAQALAGDRDAFGELVARTERPLLGLAWKLLRDRDLARDAAQETYLRIHRSLGTFRAGEAFAPWMYRIATNVCLELLRKRGPQAPGPEALDDLPHVLQDHEHPDHALLREQHRVLVRRGLDTLTPAERAAITLRDLQGLGTEEAARALGVRPVTVRTQVASARAKLQAFCARHVRRSHGGLP